MLPDKVLSSQIILDTLEVPNPQPSLLESRQLGGIALQNANQGTNVKVWTAYLDGDSVKVYAADVAETIVFTRVGISEICLAFDQNMNIFIAFVQAGVAKFYWYDSLIEDYTFSDLPVGTTYPRCTLDDHRSLEVAASDIILAYILDGNLYFRAQRDRYTIQYLLYPDLNIDVINPELMYIAMNDALRVQFYVRGNFFGS